MKVLIAIQRYPPAIGGVERYASEISRRLVVRGHLVTVLTSTLLSPKPRKEVSITDEWIDGVHIIRHRPLGMGPMTAYMDDVVPGFLLEACSDWRDTDVVFAHGYAFSSAYGILPLISRWHLPMILAAHTDPSTTVPRWIYDSTLGRAVRRAAKGIICMTTGEAVFFRRLGCAPDRVHVIPGGIDCSKPWLAGNGDCFRSKWKIPGKYVVYLGRISTNKGLDVLIRAMTPILNKDPTLRLVIAGPDGGSLSAIQHLAKRNAVAQQVVFAGPLTESEIPPVLHGSSVFVLPSKHGEALGLVILEAMAAGVPIVASRVGGIPEVISEGENGYCVPPGDEVQLRDKIHLLLSDSSTALTIGKNNAVRAARHDWGRISESVEAVLMAAAGL